MKSVLLSVAILASRSFCSSADEKPVPLVIWHGLGDNYDSDGINSIGELYQKYYPSASVHNIFIDPDPSSDRTATFFGSLDVHLSIVCQQLAANLNLTSVVAPHGIHAIGFSQGGQFLRGYVQRCNSPKIHTLITYGSQHNGIAQFGTCKPTDWVCKSAYGLLKANTWSSYVQSHLVPGQYYRDPEHLDNYLESSGWLADINNEREEKNQAYKNNLEQLKGLVMYMFDEDETVVPKETSWFDEVEEPGEDNDGGKKERKITPLRERKIYKEDWLGLKKLDEEGKIKFLNAPGRHMSISDELLDDAFKKLLWQPKGVVAVNQPLTGAMLFKQMESTNPLNVQVQGRVEI